MLLTIIGNAVGVMMVSTYIVIKVRIKHSDERRANMYRDPNKIVFYPSKKIDF